MAMEGARRLAQDTVALTVHGPAGALDLVVPPEASVDDVAREYAAKAGLQFAPRLHTRLGQALPPGSSLVDLGVHSGDVLAAGGAVRRHAGDHVPEETGAVSPGPFSVAWFTVAVAVAALAGWLGSRVGGLDTDEGRLTVALLALSAFLGVLPLGRLSAHRMVAAPAFAAAAAFAVVWAPESERLPTVVGVTALVAAVAAGVARALDVQGDEALRVWVVVGVGLFLVTGAGALLHAEPRVVWGLLLLVATLAARFVPALAVDVPDQYLIDLERLAVTAWSARDRPHGRRGRMVVPPAAVAHVAARGSRIVTASAAGVWAVVAVSAPMLLRTATLPIDRIGARAMVGLSGAALLLAARSYRHPAARTMLRGAGLTCWAALAVVLLRLVDAPQGVALGIAGVLLAVLLVVVAVATGRGWRSAWWSRRAEVAEGLAGAGAIAALVVASGLFRALWEIKFRV
jgi:ESX secretion system protein EccD